MCNICHKAKFYSKYFCFIFGYTDKKYHIYSKVMCGVVKCGLDFLWTYGKAHYLPDLGIISIHCACLIFIIFYMVLGRQICE